MHIKGIFVFYIYKNEVSLYSAFFLHLASQGHPTKSVYIDLIHFDFSLSCIGEGNGNPLQCSCLENPRDGGAWWATVYGVAQIRT